jgi:3-dehydroquinate synthase class II
VAAYGSKPESSLFFFADSFLDARAVLEALHVGVDGVVLRTEDPNEARALARYVSENAFGARVTNEKKIAFGRGKSLRDVFVFRRSKRRPKTGYR